MFITLFLIGIFSLIVYELIGRAFKSLFKLSFSYMNLIIGYMFSLTIFYILQYFLKSFIFPIYIGILVILLFISLKRKAVNIDYIMMGIIFIYIFYYFTLAFITRGDAYHYLTTINQNIDLTVFQTYTLYQASLFNIHSTIFTVNIMTFVHLFIILYTLYEGISILFMNVKESRYGFIVFMLLLTVVNVTTHGYIHPLNAYELVTLPFTGKALYLYALIPFQFALFYRYDKKYDKLLLLVNFSVMAFTSISLYLQLILNLGFILTFYIKKVPSPSRITQLILVTIFPLFVHLLIDNYPIDIILIYVLSTTLIFGFILMMMYINKYQQKKLGYIVFILFLIVLCVLYLDSYKLLLDRIKQISEGLITYKPQLLLFYGLTVYSLIKLSKDKLKHQLLLYYFPLILVFIIISPLTLYFSNIFKYLFFLLPFSFSIVFLFIKKTRLIEKVIIILFVCMMPSTIFHPFHPIRNTDQNIYYRLPQEVIDISHYFNQDDSLRRIMATKEIKDKITVSTDSIELLNDKAEMDDDLSQLQYIIHDQVPFDVVFFTEVIENYNIDAIIVDKNKSVNEHLSLFSVTKKEFTYYIIYTF